jgi:hypothetical protein
MANSKRFVVKNGLETQNIQFVEQDGTESIILTVLEDGSISFSGSSGQLFSIVDSLTGSIFSVNDISGIPSIEVFDDGKVILAETTGNVGIGTLTPTQKLDVVGNIAVSGTVDGRDIATDGSKLDGIESGATADMTASEILTAIKTVDGASSGLDADLLDGLHASSFLRSDISTVWSGSGSGIFRVDLPAGFLGSNGGQVHTLQLFQPTAGTDSFLSFHVSGDYAVHFGLDGTTNDLFVGGWSLGAVKNKVWHAGNDGTGSGLDADLLDGNHASAFALDNAVVKLTGDQTIAGNKTFSNNVTITGDLLINGATTNINTTNLVVEDKNIILGDVASPTNTTADGGGITLKGATDKTINWVNSTSSWTFNQTIRHEGLNPSTGTNVDQTKSTTFASALTTGWTDVTGVSGTYLATGSYIVQIISNGEYYTGNMSWFSGSTTTTTVDEIELHRAGAAASAARIYARVARVSGGTLKLQVSASASLSSHTMTFTFRRTI